jgi:hypothetical protein
VRNNGTGELIVAEQDGKKVYYTERKAISSMQGILQNFKTGCDWFWVSKQSAPWLFVEDHLRISKDTAEDVILKAGGKGIGFRIKSIGWGDYCIFYKDTMEFAEVIRQLEAEIRQKKKQEDEKNEKDAIKAMRRLADRIEKSPVGWIWIQTDSWEWASIHLHLMKSSDRLDDIAKKAGCIEELRFRPITLNYHDLYFVFKGSARAEMEAYLHSDTLIQEIEDEMHKEDVAKNPSVHSNDEGPAFAMMMLVLFVVVYGLCALAEYVLR